MKRFYSQFRVMLMTLAFGLASVSLFNELNRKWIEIPVNLPQIKSGTLLKVFVEEKPERKLCSVEFDGYCYCSPHSAGVPGGCVKLNEFYRIKDIKDEENGVF